MARRMDYVIDFDVPAAKLYQNFTSSRYWEQLVDIHKPIAPQTAVTHFSSDEGGTDITLTHSMSRRDLPAFAAVVVPVTVVVTRRQHFDPFDHAANSATGHYSAAVPAAPVELGGRYVLSETATGSQLRLESYCKVGIPVLGGKVEELTLAGIRSLFDSEREFTSEWIADHY